MTTIPHILVVDDEPRVCELVSEALQLSGFKATHITESDRALRMIEGLNPDLVLLDINMPHIDGLQLLGMMRDIGLRVPVVMMTGFSSMETAIKAIRMGAKDYLTKPLNLPTLGRSVSKWIEDQETRSQDQQGTAESKAPRFGMIGSSPAMIEVYKIIGAVSRTPNSSNILITGESGTGKELVARQIHNFSDHSRSPYVALNLTALPDTLIESELFGYERGAFTGANQRTRGHFEGAGDGSIFLDEIGGITPNLQQKLLRVLQEREFHRLGGRDTIPVHCRIIAATNCDLGQMSREGAFRADLYHRLNVVTVRIPPLRERVEDIPRLAEHFLHENSRELSRSLPTLSNSVIKLLCSYDWPGNVRELRHSISRAMILNRSDVLREDNFPELASTPPNSKLGIDLTDLETARKSAVESFEREYLIAMLRNHRGNVPTASELAKVTPQRFYQLMKKYQLKSEDYR